MKTKLVKILLIGVLVPIFLFLFVKEVNAGCSFSWSRYRPDICPGYCYCDVPYPEFPQPAYCGKCIGEWVALFRCDNCGQCGCGCFVEGTEINTEQESKRAGEQEGTEKIENLEPGDIVSSFNPETGEISESQVSEVHKITREGYFELETESGKKVKVTGEHPFLAVKSEENLISKLKNAFSNTLTFRLITGLQAKLVEILD